MDPMQTHMINLGYVRLKHTIPRIRHLCATSYPVSQLWVCSNTAPVDQPSRGGDQPSHRESDWLVARGHYVDA